MPWRVETEDFDLDAFLGSQACHKRILPVCITLRRDVRIDLEKRERWTNSKDLAPVRSLSLHSISVSILNS